MLAMRASASNAGSTYRWSMSADVPADPVDKVGVAKNYMYKRYGIPSSTYEVGDETDREAIRKASAIFAEELMRLMLYNRPPPSSM